MSHQIHFRNCSNDWHNALPLGNGVMGAMAFYRNGRLSLAVNHYEVYYRRLAFYRHAGMAQTDTDGQPVFQGPRYPDLERLADEKYRDYSQEAVNQYFESLHGATREYGSLYRGVSHPPTGELIFDLDDRLKDPEQSSLVLDIEAARVTFRAASGAAQAEITAYMAADWDFLVTEVSQNQTDLIRSISWLYPQRRLHEGYNCRLRRWDDRTFSYAVSFDPGCDSSADSADVPAGGSAAGQIAGCLPYRFLVVARLIGLAGTVRFGMNELRLQSAGNVGTGYLVTAVFGDVQDDSRLPDLFRRLPLTAGDLDRLAEEHRTHWQTFWRQSALRLPDRFLETLWYMNLYTLACCSGRGGKMYEQASGLSGLWDIRQPTVWGSLWYWDVNIEASYWPVYTANHPELGRVFSDGFLAHGQLAARFARDVYGVDGWAADYPHALYNCIAPWCAQFLWWHYEYTGDQAFLRDQAYPCFRKIICFIRQVAKFDPAKQQYYFYPDVSPEQGPLTRNSVITLSAVRYLLRFTLAAGRILGESPETLAADQDLLDRLSPYPLCDSCSERRLKDSEHAPADLWLRHPSLLMPIFPVGEISRNSDETWREIGKNTLAYAADSTEIGVFGFGWLSCAAARLGDGNEALRLLYEKGIDYVCRSNGLGYEETERWINYCCLDQQPLYYPPMMEASGEIAAAVNEMLLQCFDGVIEVFPAVPDGRRGAGRGRAFYAHEQADRFPVCPGWPDCRFDRFLARGGFEVSSERRDSQTAWILVKSLLGNTARIRNCFAVPQVIVQTAAGWCAHAFLFTDGIIAFSTESSRVYWLGEGPPAAATAAEAADTDAAPDAADAASALDAAGLDPGGARLDERPPAEGVMIHQAHTYRRIFLGEDENTAFIKHLDSFLFEYCLGNVSRTPVTVYKFDFGVPEKELIKDYAETVHRQAITAEKQMAVAQTFIRINAQTRFTTALGYGFQKTAGLLAVDRQGPDALRRDFICGSEPAEFLIELPKGKYDLLVVSGDPDQPSCTHVALRPEGRRGRGRRLRAGRYDCRILPLVHSNDGLIRLAFTTEPGYRWAVNMILVNRAYSFL
ncbi:MAG TPA: sugar phosphorylase [Clostridiales bacterium]|nr:sugar phosphorylase [Clostridiales bacterium]